MRRKLTDEQVAEAKRLRAEGKSYRAIGAMLGIGHFAVQYAVDPKYRERQHERRRERYATDPEFRTRRRATYRKCRGRESGLRRRCAYVLVASRNAAKARGYEPILDPASVLEDAFVFQSGRCKTCDAADDDPRTKNRLAADHCHVTGKFRAWLCSKCNSSAGKVDDNPETLARLSALMAGREYQPEQN